MTTYINLTTMKFPLYEGDIRLEYPDMEEFYIPENYAEISIVTPEVDYSSQKLRKLDPEIENGKWVCKFEVVDLTPEEIEENEANKKAFEEYLKQIEKEKLESLPKVEPIILDPIIYDPSSNVALPPGATLY